MNRAGSILLIEDDRDLGEIYADQLRFAGLQVEHCVSGKEGVRYALAEEIDAVVTDLALADTSGLEVLEKIHAEKPLLPVVFITGVGTTDTTIEATCRGAFDYLLKPVAQARLLEVVWRAVRSHQQSVEPVVEPEPLPHQSIVGRSPAMLEVYKEIGRVASTSVPVLLQGSTGTGKELVARAIHQHSPRRGKPFVAVNCAAIPEALLESELFGHEKGAFTSADARRIGRFEQAEGGTIFLDEVGELTANTQAKLLRVLQEKSIQRVGGKELIPVNTRVIAATHRNFREAVLEHRIREDFYFRLSVVVIRLPDLSERRDDIPLLAQSFLERYSREFGRTPASITPDAVKLLVMHPWPGNVRELENTMRKAILLSRGYRITAETIREALEETRSGEPPIRSDLTGWVNELLDGAEKKGVYNAHARFLEKVEAVLLDETLRRAKGNKVKASRWLGISRTTLREKLRNLGRPDDLPVGRAGEE